MAIKIAIYVYNDAEVLDFAGPFEVFNTASRVKARLQPGSERAFEVFFVAEKSGSVRGRGKMLITPHYTFANCPPVNVLIVPGGVHTPEMEKEPVINWIRQVSQATQITASVCTGAFLLAKADLLRSQSATTHWEDIPDLATMFPDLTLESEKRWVDNGHLVTSAGISAGLDMSLHLVERLESKELAVRTAHQMEYEWHFDNA